MILNFSVRNKSLLFISLWIYAFCYRSLNAPKTQKQWLILLVNFFFFEKVFLVAQSGLKPVIKGNWILDFSASVRGLQTFAPTPGLGSTGDFTGARWVLYQWVCLSPVRSSFKAPTGAGLWSTQRYGWVACLPFGKEMLFQAWRQKS